MILNERNESKRSATQPSNSVFSRFFVNFMFCNYYVFVNLIYALTFSSNNPQKITQVSSKLSD